MQTSKSNNVFVSPLAIRTWSLTPSETETQSVEPCTACARRLERQRLEEQLNQAQRDAHCVTRAAHLMMFLTAFAVIGLGHSTVFLPFWPQTMDQYLTQWPIKAHCVLGLASFGCAIAFSRLRLLYRRQLDWCVEQFRRLTIEPPDFLPPVGGLKEEPIPLKEAA